MDPTDLRGHWTLEPDMAFLNHGSFGACPAAVLARQTRWRARMEAQPLRFFVHELSAALDASRARAAAFLDADPEGFAFVRSATEGFNTVLRGLELAPGDELLVADHGYPALRNALRFVAHRSGARVLEIALPFVGLTEELAVRAFEAALSPRTRLACVDHITSPTALVLPVARIAALCAARGVDLLVDGAHAPGQVPVSLRQLGATYYTANFHKWTCAPKGAAVLWVAAHRRAQLHPLSISHGYAARDTGRSRFHEEFDWPGTVDPTPWLCVGPAIDLVGGLLPGGWPAVRARNHRLALWARDLLAEALGVAPPCPDALLGAMAALPLPDGDPRPPHLDADQAALWRDHRVEVPVVPWPRPPHRLLRVSAHLHNTPADYRRLLRGLDALGLTRR